MIERHAKAKLLQALREFPVVALVGPRQVGKTTLARQVAATYPGAILLDLERPSDLAKLQAPELYLEQHAAKLVIVDEVQNLPGLFPVLRALVDGDRRPGRFLLLGSAAPAVLQGSAESLAGRIEFQELGPFRADELPLQEQAALWNRGGFPDSLLAPSEQASFRWREAFIQTYLERDLPALGVRVPPAQLRRFWEMLAHVHGGLWNGNTLAMSLGVSGPTVRHYLDILQGSFIVRQLQPIHTNLGKRLIKSPKVYLRDSGLVHALLRLDGMEAVLGHPVAGHSWEGWVIEQVLGMLPPTWRAGFFRTTAGAELDLVLERPNAAPIALEIKRSSSPKPSRGFWSGLKDLGARGFLVCPAQERYPLGDNAEVLPVTRLGELFQTP